MTAVPGFDPGLWNAWWFLAYYWAPGLLLPLSRGMAEKMGAGQPSDARERALATVATGFLAAAALYSIGCPLRPGTWWFYLGIPLAVGGMLLLTAAIVTAARTPAGRPFITGPYRCSRHPMMVFGSLGLIGAALAAASWLLLLLAVISQGAYLLELDSEEQHCLAAYGDAYRSYRDRTPKYFGLPHPAAPRVSGTAHT